MRGRGAAAACGASMPARRSGGGPVSAAGRTEPDLPDDDEVDRTLISSSQKGRIGWSASRTEGASITAGKSPGGKLFFSRPVSRSRAPERRDRSRRGTLRSGGVDALDINQAGDLATMVSPRRCDLGRRQGHGDGGTYFITAAPGSTPAGAGGAGIAAWRAEGHGLRQGPLPVSRSRSTPIRSPCDGQAVIHSLLRLTIRSDGRQVRVT